MDVCQVCGLPIVVGEYPCIASVRPHQSGIASVIGDECDFVQHNGTREPIHFRSKIEFRRWCKENSYRVRAEHKGLPGSDKSKHTSSQSAVTAETLAGAKAMLERSNRTSDGDREIGITSGEGLVRYMAEQKRVRHGEYF